MEAITAADRDPRTQWWNDAKFGMFVHWGLYAIPAKGEWIMYAEKTPAKEYEKLAGQFNPTGFDAKAWVRLAKAAGMHYIVITAKHHDGFAMFHSQADPYNIVDATPFGRDPMKELTEACREEGIRLCFYYSHVIDWRHPHALHIECNNTWDYRLEDKRFPEYWNGKAKPQLKELLTQYGPVGLIWFDTAGGLSKEDSEDAVRHVRSLQPDCLINSRVSHWAGMGDYVSKGDNEIPISPVQRSSSSRERIRWRRIPPPASILTRKSIRSLAGSRLQPPAFIADPALGQNQRSGAALHRNMARRRRQAARRAADQACRQSGNGKKRLCR